MIPDLVRSIALVEPVAGVKRLPVEAHAGAYLREGCEQLRNG
jgi:hypothetical protein